ncbi:MAG: fasciclin domain-containing protein [Anaerolineae bacterium]|nr:fasciclin domain-containing protein [Anaerolineae bacterium]
MLKWFIRTFTVGALLISGALVIAQDVTPTPVQEMQEQATEESVMMDDNAYVRVANFAPDSDSVNVSLSEDGGSFDAVEYGQVGEWMAVPAGSYTASLNQSDVQSDETPLSAGSWTTLAIVASQEDGSFVIQPIQEAYAELIPGTAGITVVNATQDIPALNMLRDDVVYVSNLTPLSASEATSIASFRMDSGTFDIAFVQPEEPETPVVSLAQTEIPENTYMLIAVVDNGQGPETLTDITSAAEVAVVTGQLEAPGTVVEAVEAQENLTSLANAIEQTDLAEQLHGEGPFTLFAPANFVLDNNDFGSGEELANALRAYIVEGELTSQDVLNSGTLTTLDGTQLQVNLQGDNIYVNDAQILAVNIPATNGVIHIIGGSLVPQDAQ